MRGFCFLKQVLIQIRLALDLTDSHKWPSVWDVPAFTSQALGSQDEALPWSLCTLTPTFIVTPSCILSHSDSAALNLRIHLLPRMRGLWTGRMTLSGFLFHSGLDLPLLLSDEFFLVEDVHIHLSRLGLCHPEPTISLSWGKTGIRKHFCSIF